MSNQTGPGAVVAKREDRPPVEVTQARPEDPGTYVGGGKLEALATTVEYTGAWLVVIDGELSPQQMINVREAMPNSTRSSIGTTSSCGCSPSRRRRAAHSCRSNSHSCATNDRGSRRTPTHRV